MVGERPGGRFEIVWEFLPAFGREAEFLNAYGQFGPWADYFQECPQYLGTELTPIPDRPGWYRTIDRFESEGAYRAFVEAFRDRYDAIDARCAALTQEERCMNRPSC